ncbi:ATP-dependent zinc metalloprotease FtsH [Blastomonas sp. CCH4-D12]|uniref:ATP-dependent zinc metalloprotease FtsH n=1 Tax=Pseudomonadota TaxID=1224 RepID=UPI000AA553EA|nr:ATP-dependent zinc metalloprotease FtsH [Blastomonas sp. CCH4-D12]
MATPELRSPMDKRSRFNLWYWIAAFLLLLSFQSWYVSFTQIEPVPYSDFQKYLREGKLEEIAVSATDIRGKLKSPLPTGEQYFVTTRVDTELARDLDKYGVRYAGRIPSTFMRDLLSWVLPVLLFVGIWYWLSQRVAGGSGLLAIGKSRAKVYVEADTGVRFADVAGVDEAKTELCEIVGFLKDPGAYGRLGGHMPKGVLLVGPPGTGKTLLAKAVAGEAKVPFFSISGSEFVEMFVGVGAARVRDLFEQARIKAPCIIFIDELDALGRARAAAPYAGGHDEKEQTLNQLLVEMDGFDASTGVVILAATNRPEILDPALLRAGRFDRQVLVDRPDKKGRVDILAVHLKKAKLAPDVDPEQIAALTPGFTGADLANLVNEAALLATRRGADAVTMKDFTEAVERIVAGLEKRNRLLMPKEREIVAHHELGHAIVALSLPGVDPVHKVSIIPRGIGALGYTIQRPTDDRYLMTREELENKMAVLLGGRAAEHLIFGHLSTGAADDLVKATDIARAIVTRYGMSERIGHVSYDRDSKGFLQAEAGLPVQRPTMSEAVAAEVDAEVRTLVDAAFETASSILREKESRLRAAAKRLLEVETLEEAELARLIASEAPTERAPQVASVS